jgi:hypothetical protein
MEEIRRYISEGTFEEHVPGLRAKWENNTTRNVSKTINM